MRIPQPTGADTLRQRRRVGNCLLDMHITHLSAVREIGCESYLSFLAVKPEIALEQSCQRA